MSLPHLCGALTDVRFDRVNTEIFAAAMKDRCGIKLTINLASHTCIASAVYLRGE